MKKLIILSALALMMNSCTKEEAESKAPTTSLQQTKKTTFKTVEEGRLYLVSHFKPMAQEVLKVTQNNKAFKQYVYTEVAKQFDGEDNVLFQTLLSSTFVSDLAGVIPHCSAFTNIDGQNLYPQIYIPFFNKANATNGKLPVIVLFDGDESKTEYQGYTISPQGELVAFPQLITEEYAKTNEVWVISINERGGINAVKPVENKPVDKGIHPSITAMTVKEHKESWVAGGSEIRINAAAGPNGSSAAHQISPINPNAMQSYIDMLWVSRSEVSNQTQKYPNYSYYPGWNYNAPSSGNLATGAVGNVYYYVIYEYDAPPTTNRTATVLNYSGGRVYLGFPSSDGAYIMGFITYESAFSYSAYNNSISFQTY